MTVAGPSPLRVLPRGRHAAPRAVVAESQRERMLVAITDAAAEKGYANSAVADVIARAGVSRRTFYEQFENKEACFLAAYDAGTDELLEEIAEAADREPDVLESIRAGHVTWLGILADNPGFARTSLIEVLGAGPEALTRREEVHRRFAQRFADDYERVRAEFPQMPDAPRHLFRAIVGAVNEVVTAHLVDHGAASLRDVADAIAELQVRMLFGPTVPGTPAARPPAGA